MSRRPIRQPFLPCLRNAFRSYPGQTDLFYCLSRLFPLLPCPESWFSDNTIRSSWPVWWNRFRHYLYQPQQLPPHEPPDRLEVMENPEPLYVVVKSMFTGFTCSNNCSSITNVMPSFSNTLSSSLASSRDIPSEGPAHPPPEYTSRTGIFSSLDSRAFLIISCAFSETLNILLSPLYFFTLEWLF